MSTESKKLQCAFHSWYYYGSCHFCDAKVDVDRKTKLPVVCCGCSLADHFVDPRDQDIYDRDVKQATLTCLKHLSRGRHLHRTTNLWWKAWFGTNISGFCYEGSCKKKRPPCTSFCKHGCHNSKPLQNGDIRWNDGEQTEQVYCEEHDRWYAKNDWCVTCQIDKAKLSGAEMTKIDVGEGKVFLHIDYASTERDLLRKKGDKVMGEKSDHFTIRLPSLTGLGRKFRWCLRRLTFFPWAVGVVFLVGWAGYITAFEEWKDPLVKYYGGAWYGVFSSLAAWFIIMTWSAQRGDKPWD